MLCHGDLCIFLPTPLSYAAIAFYFGQYEKAEPAKFEPEYATI